MGCYSSVPTQYCPVYMQQGLFEVTEVVETVAVIVCIIGTVCTCAFVVYLHFVCQCILCDVCVVACHLGMHDTCMHILIIHIIYVYKCTLAINLCIVCLPLFWLASLF